MRLKDSAILGLISISFLIVLLVFAYVISLNGAQYVYYPPCSYEACCNPDPNERAFSCDQTGCPTVDSNWTQPICVKDDPEPVSIPEPVSTYYVYAQYNGENVATKHCVIFANKDNYEIARSKYENSNQHMFVFENNSMCTIWGV